MVAISAERSGVSGGVIRDEGPTSCKLHPCVRRHAVIIETPIPIRIRHQHYSVSAPSRSKAPQLTTPLRKPHPNAIEPAPPRRTDTRHPTNSFRLEVRERERLHAAH